MWPPLGAWLLAVVGCFALVFWTGQFSMAWLLLGLLAGLASGLRSWLTRGRRSGSRIQYGALAFLGLGLLGGLLVARRFWQIEFRWQQLQSTRRERVAHALGQHMSVAVTWDQQAALRVARAAQDYPSYQAADSTPADLFRALADIRKDTGVDGVALFSDAGELLAWAGDHRGKLPPALRDSTLNGFRFVEGPLYSYLYAATPVLGRAEHAVAAVLLEARLTPTGSRGKPLRGLPGAARGRVIFTAGGGEDALWSLTQGADTVVRARLEPITQAEWRAGVERLGRRTGLSAALVAFLLLAIIWVRDISTGLPRELRPLPLLLSAPLLGLAPLGSALGLGRLFSPGAFLLEIPMDLSLGSLLFILLPLAALAAAFVPPALGRRDLGLRVAAASAVVGVGYALALRLLVGAAGATLLESNAELWFGLQVAAVVLLGTMTYVLLPVADWPGGKGRPAIGGVPLVVGGATLAAGLSLTLGALPIDPTTARETTWALLWAAPFALLALGLAGRRGRSGNLGRWAAAGTLAASVVLPLLWNAHMRARLRAADRDLATLGSQDDAYLDFLLQEFAQEAERRYNAGEDGLLLLYRAGVASGLAQESYPVRMALWTREDAPDVQLGLGGADVAMPIIPGLREMIWQNRHATHPVLQALASPPDVNKMLTVPLGDGSIISVLVPPRRSLERAPVIAPFLGGATDPGTRLTLVPDRGDRLPGGAVQWLRTAQGWRSETTIHYPNGNFHAHLELRVTPLFVRFARGVLLLALDLGLFVLLWSLSVAARGRAPVPANALHGWGESFRARVTVALFGFFLIPTVVFGWAAYSALSGEVSRTAKIVAERAVEQAVNEFNSAPQLRVLASHAGTDVLYYYRGELARGSSPEAIELGIYDAWMPPAIFRALKAGEETTETDVQQLGENRFLIAYQNLPAAGTLAVPTALSSGDTAVRQRQLAHLLLFAILMGGLLSLGLSVVVGRTLAGPIGVLSRAVTAVGGGRLNVHLAEPAGGEFGHLFASFNRMVRRLRRARAQELRTARVLAWGEMARQIAHEIKNPLTPIKLAVQHLRRAHADRRPDFGAILETNVEHVLREIDQLAETARAFSRYGAPPELAGPLEPVDVGAVVREALTLYRAGEPAVRYQAAIADDLPAARARSAELKEVILNLLENARAAVDGQGLVEVRVGRAGEQIELEVRDDGPGIPRDMLPHVFEPHFSTRSLGTGLGLAIVRRLVEGWDGVVSAESEAGRGTSVRVRLLTVEGQPTR